MDPRLEQQLRPIAERVRERRAWRRLACCWLLAAGVSLATAGLGWGLGWQSTWPAFAVGGAALAMGWRVWRRHRARPLDYGEVVRQLEREHPRLKQALLTAAEQEPEPGSGAWGYLQQRVIAEALEHRSRRPWGQQSFEHLFFAQVAHGMALALFCGAWLLLYFQGRVAAGPRGVETTGIEVTPGDTAVERGASLVVLGRFGRPAPDRASLAVRGAGGIEQRMTMVRNLDDPVFGATIPQIQDELVYWVEADGRRTREFRVTVFEYPRLERADARLVYPAYTELGEKVVRDTRRVSAVSGTELAYTLVFNKPLLSVDWIRPDATALALEVTEAGSNVFGRAWVLERSERFQLRATDEAGRTNPVPTEFVIEVYSNQVPQLKLLAPRGDDRVSPLEEVRFTAEVSDDFGVRAFGLSYERTGFPPESIELGPGAGRHETRTGDYLLRLEGLAVRPGDLVTFHLWAEDAGPDGTDRRTVSDLHFLEVRPFEEVFRENQSGAGESGDEGSMSSEQGGDGGGLLELQKQIMVATWNLQRATAGGPPPPQFPEDARTIQESQEQARHRLEETPPEGLGAIETLETIERAGEQMDAASRHLGRASAERSAAPLAEALVAERAAYQALLQLDSHERQVAYGRSGRGRGQGGRSQRQLDQLELAQTQSRYETERQASPLDTPEERERLQFLARLNELARRQQDLNDQLGALQTALPEAQSDPEQEEIRRRLKRLQEEQREMMARLDETRQRMDRPEQQSQTARARSQLEQARAELERAADALEEGSVSRALAAGARAEEQFRELRDAFRERNSSQFSQAMRQVRDAARDLAEQQDQLRQALQESGETEQRRLSGSERLEALADQVSRQTAALTNVLSQARQISEQSEASEPLLSKELYELLRNHSQADAANLPELTQELFERGVLTRSVYDRLRRPSGPPAAQSLQATEDLLRENELAAAQRLEEKAGRNIRELKEGLENAADRILGDGLEALRFAGAELEDLIGQLEDEINRSQELADAADTPTPETSSAATQSTPPPTAPDAAAAAPSSAAEGPPESAARAGSPRAGDGARRFFDRESGGPNNGPLTGADYREWSDRLAEVESLLQLGEIETDIGRVRDRARSARAEFKRHGQPPQWDVVRVQIAGPLAEIRDQVRTELERRQSPEAVVPLDRDPVPLEYTELVRRYYDRLGRNE